MAELDIERNYEKYRAYVSKYITRPGTDKFLAWLDKSDAKTAPASTKYHLSCEGGLIQHSLNVFTKLIQLTKMEYGDDCPYSNETLALVALLHDISKINFYKIDSKNVKNEQGQWEKVPYYTVRDDDDRLIYGSHSENSVYMVKKFFNLSYEEELAILYHMGGMDTTEDKITSKNVIQAFKKSELALLLHTADMFATCIVDEDE